MMLRTLYGRIQIFNNNYVSNFMLSFVVLIIFCVTKTEFSNASSNYSCYSYNGILDNRALIKPATKTSIKLEVGEALEVTCSVNPSSGFTSTNIHFRKVNKNGSIQRLDSKIIDKYSIRAKLSEIQATKFRLDCSSENDTFCSRIVAVGYPPLMVENLLCISYNWESLVCSFDLPMNPAQDSNEDYILSYTIENDAQSKFKKHFGDHCLSSKDSCCHRSKQWGQKCWQWNSSHRHFLEKFSPVLNLTIESSNALGNRSYNYQINQFERMVPDPVEDLVAEAAGPSGIIVTFKLPRFLKGFPPGIIYRLIYETSFEQRIYTSRTSNAAMVRTNLVDLWPGHLYSITAQLRSGDNELQSGDFWWSDPQMVQVQTPSTAPMKPPATHRGLYQSFLSATSNDTRNVVLYWKELEEKYRGGQDFYYRIDGFQRNSTQELFSQETFQAYAIFPGLSIDIDYQFVITPMNSEGKGPQSSLILVHKNYLSRSDAITPIFTYLQEEGVVELRWYNKSIWKVENFTLIWCQEDDFDSLQNICKNVVSWKDFLWQKILNLTSNNLETSSSLEKMRYGTIDINRAGILWSSCKTSTYTQSLDSVSAVKFHLTTNGPQSISVSWDLNCQQWSRIPITITILWCQENSPDDLTSQDFEIWQNNFDFEDLEPNMNYSFWVRVRYESGLNSTSSPLFLFTPKDVLEISSVLLVSSLSFVIIFLLALIIHYSRKKFINYWNDSHIGFIYPDGLAAILTNDMKDNGYKSRDSPAKNVPFLSDTKKSSLLEAMEPASMIASQTSIRTKDQLISYTTIPSSDRRKSIEIRQKTEEQVLENRKEEPGNTNKQQELEDEETTSKEFVYVQNYSLVDNNGKENVNNVNPLPSAGYFIATPNYSSLSWNHQIDPYVPLTPLTKVSTPSGWSTPSVDGHNLADDNNEIKFHSDKYISEPKSPVAQGYVMAFQNPEMFFRKEN